MIKKSSTEMIHETLSDPSAHTFLKHALKAALACDPVDAANDAEYLFLLLSKRAAEIFGEARPEMAVVRG